MKEFHISFVAHPMPPHVGPTLPVVSALVRRGYRVTYVTPKEFSSRVAAVGADVIYVPSYKRVSTLQPHERVNFQHPYCRSAIKTLARIIPFYMENKPDLIVYDVVALAGRILASKLSIPAVQTCPTFPLHRETFEQQVIDSGWRGELLELSSHADRFLISHGIGASDFLFHREKLNIYFVPKALQPEGDVLDATCFCAGRCAGEQSYYGEWRKINSESRPLVLVSTSTVYLQGTEFFELCMQALSGLQCHTILSIGDEGDATSLSPLPPHCEVVQGTSHVKILPHVSLFICLGGNITVAEAAYFGVPLIVTSHGFPELEYQGDNVVKFGVGLHLRKSDLSVETLRRSAVQVLADGTMLNRVKHIQRAVRREPGAEETANRIEDYIDIHCN